MSDNLPGTEWQLSPEELERVDRACDRFEEAWRNGQRPQIKAFVDDLSTAAGKVVLRELLKVELDYRIRNGEQPTTEEYKSLFPEHADLINAFFESILSRPAGADLNAPASSPWQMAQAPAEPSTYPPAEGAASASGETWPWIQGFELEAEVGRGAMGVVYRARHKRLEMQVAIKVMLPNAPPERFLREARLLARIRSPYVVAVHDIDVLPNGSQVLVMEWVEGTDLRELIRAQSDGIPEEKVLPFMRHTCEGMLAAAEQSIVHRDLKPSNLLIDDRGCARVADFGLARGPASQESLYQPGVMMGTPHYMAPEQWEDPHGVDTRADIYSFGATFYHALTGKPPFEGETPFSILYKHKTEPLISPQARKPDLSSRTSELLERCLAKVPADRFSSFSEILALLQSGGAEPSPWSVSDDAVFAAYWARYESRRKFYLDERQVWNRDLDAYQFPRGQILRIVDGDIVEQRVDAIVSSDTCNLDMDGGVSAAIRAAAGELIAVEAKLQARVRPGRAIVTAAGNLPARLVFHGVTVGWVNEVVVRPSRDLITEIMASCFYHADSHDVRSIAFPLLGTGAQGFPRDICLDTMFQFLARMFLRGLTSVREARVVLFD
jgi:eukaryotic-like serine/threonine-protein kinase